MGYQGNFDFFYGKESERYSYITIPKLLLKDEKFKRISAEAKLMYGLLLDRNSLSRKNGWLDEQNRVYIIYTIKEIQEDLNCATEKVSKVLKELEEMGLIYRKRNGRGKANYIYVMDYMSIYRREREVQKGAEDGDKNFDNRNSGISISENQGFRKSKCNNTDINKTDFSMRSAQYGGGKRKYGKSKNAFCNFPQREYDFEELERMLLANPVTVQRTPCATLHGAPADK